MGTIFCFKSLASLLGLRFPLTLRLNMNSKSLFIVTQELHKQKEKNLRLLQPNIKFSFSHPAFSWLRKVKCWKCSYCFAQDLKKQAANLMSQRGPWTPPKLLIFQECGNWSNEGVAWNDEMQGKYMVFSESTQNPPGMYGSSGFILKNPLNQVLCQCQICGGGWTEVLFTVLVGFM